MPALRRVAVAIGHDWADRRLRGALDTDRLDDVLALVERLMRCR